MLSSSPPFPSLFHHLYHHYHYYYLLLLLLLLQVRRIIQGQEYRYEETSTFLRHDDGKWYFYNPSVRG